MAEITGVIYGQFTAPTGPGSKTLELPPGRRAVWAIMQPRDATDAGSIVFGLQQDANEPWTDLPTYSVSWDSAAAGDVVVNFYLITIDESVPFIPYGGV